VTKQYEPVPKPVCRRRGRIQVRPNAAATIAASSRDRRAMRNTEAENTRTEAVVKRRVRRTRGFARSRTEKVKPCHANDSVIVPIMITRAHVVLIVRVR